MLKQRIITAIVLLAILLPALFWETPEPFMAVTLVLLTAAGWEWGRLNQLGSPASIACAVVLLVLCAAAWAGGALAQPRPLLWSVAAVAWVIGGASLIATGVPGWPRIARPVRLVGGVLALWVAWLAVADARMLGINFLLSVLVLVWVADIFAYFAGRAFGTKFVKRKLAPSISPGKSWEGVAGGMIGVLVLAVAWTLADRAHGGNAPSLYTVLAGLGWPVLVAAAIFLAAMSVVGDLVESLVKRAAGMKDSSGLLPGHGGVLDRVDALLPVLPLAMMMVTLAAR
ncbi:MAG TPA: phosphatidate cytidylyltransferase [Ramlibacter sp.]|uniref:phosphatidate cytidylyltransferase n=1 Tax=Ramlibacter sp. TaxID=1917967 RepID=UPI002BE3C0BF|nr:phosphatidate cytidylyltransferase [Ramlibacter sp.]HVZ43069.1 phosphatidate cytidylyltransferase [Ramlibacter sp.]